MSPLLATAVSATQKLNFFNNYVLSLKKNQSDVSQSCAFWRLPSASVSQPQFVPRRCHSPLLYQPGARFPSQAISSQHTCPSACPSTRPSTYPFSEDLFCRALPRGTRVPPRQGRLAGEHVCPGDHVQTPMTGFKCGAGAGSSRRQGTTPKEGQAGSSVPCSPGLAPSADLEARPGTQGGGVCVVVAAGYGERTALYP